MERRSRDQRHGRTHARRPVARGRTDGARRSLGGYIAALLESDTEVPLGTTDDNRRFRGGSLIDARTVLSAAHCVFTSGVLQAPHQMEVLIGRPNLLVAGGRKHLSASGEDRTALPLASMDV